MHEIPKAHCVAGFGCHPEGAARSFPPEPPTAAGLPWLMQIHVGCSGWFYSHWRGIFYPAHEVTTKNWFAYYANVFRTVELNAPFYRWPSAITVRRWRREAPPGFVYSVKVNRKITHEKRLVGVKRLIAWYGEIATTLGDKMGCFLWQFPPGFKYTPGNLKHLVTQLDPALRNVVEFRHKSWWRASVYRALAARNITFCAVSAPRLPDTFPLGQRVLYVRFSGRTRWYRHDYTAEELAIWAMRIRASGAKEAWIYFNNDREGHAVKNALQLRRILRDMAANPELRPAAGRPEKAIAAITFRRPKRQPRAPADPAPAKRARGHDAKA